MNKLMKSARSYLFVPANRVERFKKALNTDSDAVIIDLEDAVPLDLKQSSRDALATWLQNNPEHQVMIRVNSSQTEWFLADIELAKFPNVSAIVLPKTESSTEIEAVLKIREVGIFPLIETPLGFANVRQIACTKQVIALMFGTIDFQLEMNMNGGYLELLSFRNEIVLASQLAKIQAPVDGVTVDFKDEYLIQLEAQQAKNLGFAGKLCIHPNQVNLVNQTFNPSAQEIIWANQIMQAVNDAKGQAVSLNGKMIDLPIVLQAQKIIDRVS